MLSREESFLARCLQLAKRGETSAAPNPLVGCVIVHRDRIIGEGWHYRAGEPHAEVLAIRSVRDPALLPASELYVNLEPCAHYGRTPPCADLIVRHGIAKVFIGTRDPFSKVNGAGIARLQAAGIAVEENILAPQCRELNRFFFTYHQQKRPFISLKWAESPDGFFAREREKSKGIHWISQPATQAWTHRLRSSHQAILVGRATVASDNPRLDVRAVQGPDPLRVIIDPQGQTDPQAAVFRDEHHWLYSLVDQGRPRQIVLSSEAQFLPELLQHLYQQGIQSLLVEGGAETLRRFIAAGLWDEAWIIRGIQALGRGMAAPALGLVPEKRMALGRDIIEKYRPL